MRQWGVGPLLFLAACDPTAVSRDRQLIRKGLLVVGLDHDDFVKEWGLPDRTESAVSGEVLQVRRGIGGGPGPRASTRGHGPSTCGSNTTEDVKVGPLPDPPRRYGTLTRWAGLSEWRRQLLGRASTGGPARRLCSTSRIPPFPMQITDA